MPTPGQGPRTVLMLSPSTRLLGARRSLLALAEGLDPERWRPVVCAQSHGQLGREMSARGIPFHAVKLGWWRKGKYFLWRPFAIARLASLARSVGADLIHCNEIYPNPYAIRAARNVPGAPRSPRAGLPIPVVTHVRLGIKPDMIHKYDLDRADRIVAISESIARDFTDAENLRERVRVVYNGVNLEEYHRTRSAEAARLQIGMSAEGPVLAAIGQVGPRKGDDIILEAVARAAEAFPTLQVIFVGDTHRGQEEFAARLHAKASRPPLAGRVRFFPFTPQILPYYEAADINLLISRDEGFGRTLIEARALGVPSIGARVGGIAEIILDGVSGRLVPPEDPAALAEAIRAMLSNPTVRAEMADAAFRRSAQHFSAAAHVQRMMDLYDEALESKPMFN